MPVEAVQIYAKDVVVLVAYTLLILAELVERCLLQLGADAAHTECLVRPGALESVLSSLDLVLLAATIS